MVKIIGVNPRLWTLFLSEAAIKRQALIFNTIAVPDLDSLKKLVPERFELSISEIDWLLANEIIYDPFQEARSEIQFLFSNEYDIELRKAGTSVDSLLDKKAVTLRDFCRS